MKVMLINNIYPSGSTGKIVFDLESELIKKGNDVVVVYGHGPRTSNNHYRVCGQLYKKIQALLSRITGLMYSGCLLSTWKIKKLIKKENPDIIHLHCLNGHFINIPRIITWLKSTKYKVILTNHAEFMYTGNCGHALECMRYQEGCGKCKKFRIITKSWFFDRTSLSWRRMKKAFECSHNRIFIANVSPWLTNRAKNSIILNRNQHYTILNGLDTNVFNYKGNYQKDKVKKIFFVTPFFTDDLEDIKGGRFVIEIAKKMKEAKFIIAGKYKNHMSLPPNIILLGQISDQNQLANSYSSCDVTILTSQKETFSMVTVESLCCGTPVVGFEAGAPELISINKYSEFVEYGNIDKLVHAIYDVVHRKIEKKEISNNAIKKYSKEKMCDNYMNLYKKLCEGLWI